MRTMDAAHELMGMIESVGDAAELAEAMDAVATALGFDYFALAHHIDLRAANAEAIRLHNYPAGWAEHYERHALAISDPVHRASHVTSIGFAWSRIPMMIPLTANDLKTLAMGSEQGIADGFTVPAHVPGEARGSCSFAIRAGRGLPRDVLPLAQLAGAFAFEAARRLSIARGEMLPGAPALTDRQRDCVVWIGRGKSNWEISRILGVSEETVVTHVKQACDRYAVSKRTLLVIRALFDGTISFNDVLRRGHPPFWG
ncbi:LuxR family transcriptional regulator [Sphingomonas sp. CJ99]